MSSCEWCCEQLCVYEQVLTVLAAVFAAEWRHHAVGVLTADGEHVSFAGAARRTRHLTTKSAPRAQVSIASTTCSGGESQHHMLRWGKSTPHAQVGKVNTTRSGEHSQHHALR